MVCPLLSILDVPSLLGSDIQQGVVRTILPSLKAVELTSSR